MGGGGKFLLPIVLDGGGIFLFIFLTYPSLFVYSVS